MRLVGVNEFVTSLDVHLTSVNALAKSSNIKIEKKGSEVACSFTKRRSPAFDQRPTAAL